jgi:hypothetical protein
MCDHHRRRYTGPGRAGEQLLDRQRRQLLARSRAPVAADDRDRVPDAAEEVAESGACARVREVLGFLADDDGAAGHHHEGRRYRDGVHEAACFSADGRQCICGDADTEVTVHDVLLLSSMIASGARDGR